MSFYDNSQPWSAGPPGQTQRQPSWEQPPPPSRSGTSSVGAREEPNAFIYQLAEVERAIDNLVKSGKMPFGLAGGNHMYSPGMGGRTPGPMGGDFDGRPHSGSGLQNYYQNQRFGPRPTEADQMQQAKRRMAAQRERELRNYHQEQQYAKNMSSGASSAGGPNSAGPGGPKSDRSMSPNTGMSEDERRELIARQHRALYGNESNLYSGKDGSRPGSQDARAAMGPRGGSPLAYDPFGMQGGPQAGQGEPAVQMPPRSGPTEGKDGNRSPANDGSSPASNQNPTFGMFENAQQSSRTSNSSPTAGSSPPGSKAPGATAPIGTRPAGGQQPPMQGLQKRSTTPLPSPLSYGFTAQDQQGNERSTSATSQNAPQGNQGWGNNSGVWGNPKSGLGVQASVWG